MAARLTHPITPVVSEVCHEKAIRLGRRRPHARSLVGLCERFLGGRTSPLGWASDQFLRLSTSPGSPAIFGLRLGKQRLEGGCAARAVSPVGVECCQLVLVPPYSRGGLSGMSHAVACSPLPVRSARHSAIWLVGLCVLPIPKRRGL